MPNNCYQTGKAGSRIHTLADDKKNKKRMRMFADGTPNRDCVDSKRADFFLAARHAALPIIE